MNNLVLTLLILPMIGSLLAFGFGKINSKISFWIAYFIGIVLFGITLDLYLNFTNPIDIPMIWFKLGEFSIPFGIYIDRLSLVMLLIATGLGFLDIHFAHDYMAKDPHKPRYYAKVLFFIGGMILLVSAKDMISLFVGWEFMGLASYLLISFWHESKDPADAGLSAFLLTRFGDIFLFASIGILFYMTGSLDLLELNHLASSGEIDKNILYLVSIFIFIAAVGKSGQFPLFPWLMRAMEGPTTVSALIHGATMVNSGIYIVARLFDFYVASQTLIVVAIFGAISAFIGATSALVQSEIKKVLAYSTMSHLSLAFIGLGAGSLSAGMGHLVNHAIFKALLFLGAGAMIMSVSHTKDLWKYGGYSKKMLGVAIAMGLGALSLSGIPPFSGYYSKDAILIATLQNSSTYGIVSTLTIISAVLSVAYISRVWILLFAGKPRDEKLYESSKKPSFFWIVLPLLVMGFITFILGFYQENISFMVTDKILKEPHLDGLTLPLLSSIGFLAFIVYYFYAKRIDIVKKVSAQPLMKAIHKVLFNGYFVEFFIHYFAKKIVVDSFAKTINYIDINIVDKSVNKMVNITNFLHNYAMKIKSDKASNNSGAMIWGVVVILFILLVGGIK